jgi:hypothetical protein
MEAFFPYVFPLDFLRSKDANPDDTLGRTKLGRPISRLEKKRMEPRGTSGWRSGRRRSGSCATRMGLICQRRNTQQTGEAKYKSGGRNPRRRCGMVSLFLFRHV